MSLKSNVAKILIFTLCYGILQTGIYVLAIEENESKLELTEHTSKKIVNKVNFEDIVQKAIEHSYDLQIADYNVLISKQLIRNARSEYFPKLNLLAGTEYTKNFRDANESTVMSIGDAFINPYTRYQSVLGITVTYNLFDFGVKGERLKMAKGDVELKELENRQKLQELKLTLLDAYTKILLTDRQIAVNKAILNTEEKNLEYYERLYKAKEISKTELNDAKIKVSTTKNKINELMSIEQESINWLSFYTGEKYDINSLQISDIKNSDFDVFEYQDYTKSIIWKIHEKNIKQKELELHIVKKNNYPKLNLYGRYYLYGSERNNYGDSLNNIEPSNFSVGASFNMPVFDGFKNSASIEKTSLELKQMLIERDKAIAQLMTRLANMRSNLTYIDKQICEHSAILYELYDKEKSEARLLSKKIISPIEYNNSKIELMTQDIEYAKNIITKSAITKGIQILTE